jgi:hypothetical protein
VRAKLSSCGDCSHELMNGREISVYQLYDRCKGSYSKAIYSRSIADGKDGHFGVAPRVVAALPALGEPPLAGGSRAWLKSGVLACLVWCSALVVLQHLA